MNGPATRGPRADATYRANRPRPFRPYLEILRKQRAATHPAMLTGKLYTPSGSQECVRRLRQAGKGAAS